MHDWMAADFVVRGCVHGVGTPSKRCCAENFGRVRGAIDGVTVFLTREVTDGFLAAPELTAGGWGSGRPSGSARREGFGGGAFEQGAVRGET
ncbi:hypothetical protein GCM10027059_45890 [Myceligenerans halotolerans]